MRKFITIVLIVSAAWLPFAGWYLCRGMARQSAVSEALAVFRSPDSTDEQVAAAQKSLIDGGYETMVLLYLVQELNQEEHRAANMRLCRGISRLLGRRQEHSAADAASRLLDATFMWPHVRNIPDLVIQLKKSAILEPTRRKRVNDLIKALNDLCLERELELAATQIELLAKGLDQMLAQPDLAEDRKQLAVGLTQVIANLAEGAPLPQTFAQWQVLDGAARLLTADPDNEEATKSVTTLQEKVQKQGPRSSFVVSGLNKKLLGNALKRLQDHESKWKQTRGVTSSTLRFEPTSMEELQDYVDRVNDAGMLSNWQTALLDPFGQAKEGATLDLTASAEAIAAWRDDVARRGAQIESLCKAMDQLAAGTAKPADITRQAALYCLTDWQPRNGLEGATEDTPLDQLQDFLWGDREWLSDELKETGIVAEVCARARERVETRAALQAVILSKASQQKTPLSRAEAQYLADEARTCREIQKLPGMLAEVLDGEAAPLDAMTPAQRTYLSLKCLHLQSKYRKGRRQVANATKVFAKKVVDRAEGQFGNRTKGEEVGNLRAIMAIWRQRDEEMITGDIVRLLQSPYPEIRDAARAALRHVGRPAIGPLEHVVSTREINQLMAVETAELSKEDHTKLLERDLRTGRSESGRALAAIGAGLLADLKKRNVATDEDADLIRIRRALHNALNDPRSGLEELRETDADLNRHLVELELVEQASETADTKSSS